MAVELARSGASAIGAVIIGHAVVAFFALIGIDDAITATRRISTIGFTAIVVADVAGFAIIALLSAIDFAITAVGCFGTIGIAATVFTGIFSRTKVALLTAVNDSITAISS